MMDFTVEWVFVQDMYQQNPVIDRKGDPRITIPVVRLPEVDEVIEQAVKFAEGYKGKLEQQHGALAYKYGQYVDVCAFLDSQVVKAWRERQEQNGKKEQGYSRAEFENDQMGQTGTDLSRKEPS